MTVRVLAEAEQDIADGFHFYESQQPGLGSRFVETLLADIDDIAVMPEAYGEHFGYRRLLASRFPFAVYYCYNPNHQIIDIHAVLDCRQNPDRIANRLR